MEPSRVSTILLNLYALASSAKTPKSRWFTQDLIRFHTSRARNGLIVKNEGSANDNVPLASDSQPFFVAARSTISKFGGTQQSYTG